MNRFKHVSRAAAARKISKMLAIILAATITALPISPAFAASRSVTLAVSNVTCSTCWITVKRALFGVRGVEKVVFNLDKKEAAVTFDDAQTTVKALTKATEDAGYPSHVVGGH